MKVLFAGPTLHGVDLAHLDLSIRPPAAAGDLVRAVRDGADAIGLVDGLYGDRAAVWHKEILYALDVGVAVVGAASMGALRAAECKDFGMAGVGQVFAMYADGRLDDDAAVAQLHAPEELGCMPLTEALVNVLATVDELESLALVSAAEADALRDAASAVHFRARTYRLVIGRAIPDPGRRRDLLDAAFKHRVDVKRQDAMLLVAMLAGLPSGTGTKLGAWNVRMTERFRQLAGEC